MMTISTCEAVQMLEAGWTVKYCKAMDSIEWRSPDGMSGYSFHSESLDRPPELAVEEARRRGDVKDIHRTA
jgi:hypothetical protein